ncbi:type IX secretion system sortase PorU [Labilibaculum sp.]|uniref:type IX secretion system sortase PorU n=1 Tax=Labilibaculum sp. TaxID=2060723 RepID=UPI00356227CD
MRYLTLIFLLLASTTSFSQTTDPIDLEWSESIIIDPSGETITTLSFTGASLSKDNSWLPEYSILQLIGSEDELFTVEIFDTEFKLLSSTERQLLKNKNIPSEINPVIHSLTIRKQNYQQVKFIPIRKNPSTGEYQKLIQFSLKFNRVGQTKSSSLSKSYLTNSVLSSGEWLKIAVDTTAVHKITYTQLNEMGINKPENIRVYGSGGGMLSKMNSDTSIDDLTNNLIYMSKGSDGIFNSGDFILFYAKGPRSWEYDEDSDEFIHENHLYSNYSYYFLSSDMGNATTIPSVSSLSASNVTVDGFDDYAVFDQDETNLLESGRLWLGDSFDVTTSYSYSFSFPNCKTDSPILIHTDLVARSSSASTFQLVSESTSIGEIEISSVNTDSYTSNYAEEEETTFTNFTPSSSNFELSLEYEKSTASSEGWINFIRVNARRNLIFTGSQMAFRDVKSVGTNNKALFSLQNSNANTLIWDVSSPQNIQEINGNYSNGAISFIADASLLKEYVAINPNGNFPTPVSIGTVQNQNLHALDQTDMIIISPSKFTSYASKIADFHRTNDDLEVLIVDPEQIYNEFSSGAPDVSAIRNFVKMIYDRSASELEMPNYLLLLGDGSYDNKSDKESNTNQILTYQSENSLSPTQSYVTDDFFGLLDDDEGEASGLVDIGIGRLPVNTLEEAQIVSDKIVNYNSSNYGDWRSKICFVADDEDYNTHMRDADSLAVQIENNYPQYKIQRIFLDDYEQITNSAGQTYPDVNEEIRESVNNGRLLVNYTGHGNENGLAHEYIMMVDDITGWENPTKLPLFLTATCEFSRFDNYAKESAGELILLRNDGGGIGLFTTTRLVYSSPNFNLNQNFYNYAFELDTDGNHLRLGDIMRKTKNATSSSINKRNFTLLADPALQLNYPEHSINTIQINDVDFSETSDTLKALSTIKISGQIIANTGEEITEFSGTVYPTVYDKESLQTTLGNDGDPFEYTSQSSVIFNGKATVSEGSFSFSFFVPKDINYQYGRGKISYYANSDNSDAAGYTNSIIIGGTNPNAADDETGPEIELYMNNEQFITGGTTDSSPLLYAIVQDSSGINTLGNSIGHDITAILDQNSDESINLNSSFESDLDNYQKGTISYQLTDLETGEHEIQLKVWDNVNNSSENTIDFIVSDDIDLSITHLLNYPNPFTTNTGFYFEHNQASQELDILIQILTISGKLIKTIETSTTSSSSRVGPIEWDGKDDFGNSIGRGVYFYRVRIRTNDGKTVNKFQKLVILK